MPDSRAQSKTPLASIEQSESPLEIVRERPEAAHGLERPHCDEHFLFTSHCAACIAADQTAAVHANASPQARPATRSSRSFGFTDNLTPAMVRTPSIAQYALNAALQSQVTNAVSDTVGSLLDLNLLLKD